MALSIRGVILGYFACFLGVSHLEKKFSALFVLLLRFNNYSFTLSFIIWYAKTEDARLIEAATARASALLRMLLVNTAKVSSQLSDREEKGYVNGTTQKALCLDLSDLLRLCLGNGRVKISCYPWMPQSLLSSVTLDRHRITQLDEEVSCQRSEVSSGDFLCDPFCWVAL